MVTDLDENRLSTVMGSGSATIAQPTPKELQDIILADSGLESALNESVIEHSSVRKAVRKLMESYCDSVTRKALDHAKRAYVVEVIRPMAHRAAAVQVAVKSITDISVGLSTAVLRISGGSVNESEAKINLQKFDEDLKVVEKAVSRTGNYSARIETISAAIDVILDDVTGAQLGGLSALQDDRSALEKERVYVEKGLIKHFEVGTVGSFEKLVELIIPEQLQQGKGKELIRNVKAFLNNRTRNFFAILPELQLCMSNAMVGLQKVPPSKVNGYVDVKDVLRDLYAAQSLKLYEELERKLPKETVASIRKEFKYGVEEKKIKCEVGDGVTALFCLLALYRPNGLHYRETIKDKLALCPAKFNDGSCPSTQIKTIWPTLQEAMDLGVHLQWSRIGKPIVTALTERNNIFARALTEYADITKIVDLEDSAVEISRMLSAVEQACKDLDDAGISTKRAAFTSDYKPQVCWYGSDCNRPDCNREHKPAGKGAPKGKGKGKGKGGGRGTPKGKGGGKVEDKTTTKQNPDKTCKAKDCPASGKGFSFCVTCHRKLMEDKKITLKDGTEEVYTPSNVKGANKRALRTEQGEEEPEDSQEMFSFGPDDHRAEMVREYSDRVAKAAKQQ
jgi:hypothetical protein